MTKTCIEIATMFFTLSGLATAASPNKTIALTFDDGPKPYVLYGSKTKEKSSPSLLDLLDRDHVKATFFVMGWRVKATTGRICGKDEVGHTCREGIEEVHRRGHEIENHTYGHGQFRTMVKRYGEAWVLNDIDRCSRVIEEITGSRPHYVRPPDWIIWEALRRKIEQRGYRLMTKNIADVHEPPVTANVDSEDYFCEGKNTSRCPKPSLYESVLRKIHQRERQGVYQHILVFHELPVSVNVLSRLIPDLEAQGYKFMLLEEYMRRTQPRATSVRNR